jgi:4-hydroxy-tetrahydrodipicolinate synthase
VRCFQACSEGDWEKAVSLAKRFQPLIDAVFAPPVRDYRARTKACLYLQGVIPNKVVRPPLVEVAESELDGLRRALTAAGLKVVN